MSNEKNSRLDEKEEVTKIKGLAWTVGFAVTATVVSYAVIVIYLTWPISKFSTANAGVFGDSFGILTALFSGLAFAGIIITILLQRIELKLQRQELRDNRKEFAKSAVAQERNAQLVALTTLLNEYSREMVAENDYYESQNQFPSFVNGAGIAVIEKVHALGIKKDAVETEIEKILMKTGIRIPETQ